MKYEAVIVGYKEQTEAAARESVFQQACQCLELKFRNQFG